MTVLLCEGSSLEVGKNITRNTVVALERADTRGVADIPIAAKRSPVRVARWVSYFRTSIRFGVAHQVRHAKIWEIRNPASTLSSVSVDCSTITLVKRRFFTAIRNVNFLINYTI